MIYITPVGLALLQLALHNSSWLCITPVGFVVGCRYHSFTLFVIAIFLSFTIMPTSQIDLECLEPNQWLDSTVIFAACKLLLIQYRNAGLQDPLLLESRHAKVRVDEPENEVQIVNLM